MNIEIKKLDKNDSEDFKNLCVLFTKVFDEKDLDDSDLPPRDYLENILRNNTFCAFVAKADKKVIGGITGYIFPMYYPVQLEMYIYDLAVSKVFRNQGIAKRLFNILINYAKENNIKVVFLGTGDSDFDAINFYKSMNLNLEQGFHIEINL